MLPGVTSCCAAHFLTDAHLDLPYSMCVSGVTACTVSLFNKQRTVQVSYSTADVAALNVHKHVCVCVIEREGQRDTDKDMETLCGPGLLNPLIVFCLCRSRKIQIRNIPPHLQWEVSCLSGKLCVCVCMVPS